MALGSRSLGLILALRCLSQYGYGETTTLTEGGALGEGPLGLYASGAGLRDPTAEHRPSNRPKIQRKPSEQKRDDRNLVPLPLGLGTCRQSGRQFSCRFLAHFGQIWPRDPSGATGLVLQCRLHNTSARHTNSNAISSHQKTVAWLL